MVLALSPESAQETDAHMSNRQEQRVRSQRGFSLAELMVVVGIILVISAFALPSIARALASIRLRSTATSVNGLIQQVRMQAVRDNKFYTMRTQAAAPPNGLLTLYIDTNGNGALDPGEPSVAIAADTVINDGTGGPATVPTNVAFPPYVKFATLGVMSFNERGLPCSNPPACNTIDPYIIYLRQTQPLGAPAWAAITVTRAGRVKALTYQPGTPAPSWN
jgi:prepilin-type N-terminal cleavage/methylation domain-containing protein